MSQYHPIVNHYYPISITIKETMSYSFIVTKYVFSLVMVPYHIDNYSPGPKGERGGRISP